MKQCLRIFILFVLFLPTVITAQVANTSNADRPGIPGTCSFCNNPSVFHTNPNDPTPQNGNGTLGNIYSASQCGLNFTQASNRLGQRFSPAGIGQPAAFGIAGIPAGAVILKAYLWAEGSGNGAAQTATVSGPLGSANYPMAVVGVGVDKCWGYGGSYTYRADVTASVNGNGTYNISGILTNPPTAGNDMDGATLLVVYADPSQPYTGNIRIDDGAMVCTTFGGSTIYNMTYPAVCGPTTNAVVFGCMGDLQNTTTTMTWNGSAIPYAWNWWNYLSAGTTVTAGQTTSNFTSLGNGDCFNFCVAGLYYRTTCGGPTLTISSTPASCSACNGSATVTVNPAGAYTYSWSPSGGTGASAINLCAGNYTVSVVAGCTTATASVNVPTSGGSITTSGAQTNVSCNGSCNGSATVTIVTGTGPFTYAWTPTGGTGSSATGLCPGSYTCTVTGAGGCTGTQTFTITQPPAITNTASQVNISCFSACNGSATVVASGGTGIYTYSWAPTGGTGPSATNLCPGTYTCTISSPAGCTHTQTFNITQPPQITLAQSQVNISCNGACTGSATVVASGGTGVYTYSWSPSGGSGPTASSLCVGTYTCTVSSPAGCTATASFNITQPPPLTATQSQVDLTCNSVCNGSATVVASGGTGVYTYAWSPSGGSGSTASSLCAGTYSCVISSPAGCSITQTFNITQPPAITATQSQTNVSCNGACDGTASVVASGGTGTYTYAWAPSGGSSATATGLCAGTYTVTISSPAGCSITKTFNITQATAITAVTSTTTSTCGNTNGSATVNPSGGVPGYLYSWSPVAGAGPTLSNLAAGAYTCVVTDAAGCTATFVVNVPNAGSPSATITSFTNVTCYGACDGTANVAGGGGTGPYSYSWSPAGGPVPNATNLCPGLYTATVTDANGCIATATVNITQPPQITSTTSQVNITCNALCNGSATVVASGGTGTYTYSWAPSGGTGATASSLCAGTYTCTISSPAGCTATASFNITQPTALSITPSQTNVTCNGSCNGSATVVVTGGTPVYTYAWAPTGGTGSTANGLCAGNYTVTVTDANGCTITQTFNITQPPALTATSSFVQSTCGNPNGSATVTASGGTPNYSYSWNTVPVQNTATATNLLAGTYICTITDLNLCTITMTVTVPNAGSPTATITAFTNVTCNGFCDGTATVTASGGTGPYSYSWSPSGGNGSNATGLCPGTYTVTVTDANGCIATATVTITEPPALTISGTQTDVTCNAACNGSATVVVGGGTPGYNYSWAPSGGTGSSANALCAGSYTCTVTDANGCTITQTFNITEPTPLTVAAAGFNVSCYGTCDGQIVAIPGGGTPNYQFAWSTGCTSPSCNNICAGVYTITVSDAMGCTATATATVTQPTQLTFSTTSQMAHCNQADGCVDVINPAGGTGNITCAWTGGPSNTNWCGVTPGIYTFTLTDANGCDTTSTVSVGNIPGVASSYVSSTNVSCNGACDGTATCSTVAGTGTITYAWAPSGGNALTATNLCNGTYTFTATDSAGCTDTTIINITQPAPLSVSASATPAAVCAGTPLTVSATSTGGTQPATFSWPSIPGTGPTQTYSPTTTGPVTVIATDQNGCVDSTTVNITVNPIPVAQFAGDSLSGCAPLCVNFTDMSTLASGSFSGWFWDFGDGNTSNIQNPQHCYANAGTYNVTLTVTSSAGCTITLSMTNYITVYPNPVANFTAGPQPTTELDPTIYFTDASSGNSTWLWSFGDASPTSTLQNPVYAYQGPGCYGVVLTVTTVNGCWDTATQVVCIDPDVTLYVPNAFTPDGDGKNDNFIPQGIGIDPDKFEMWIFDRWGNMIFYTDDFYQGWNGKVQGHEDICQIDTYVWKIKAEDIKGGKHNLIGKVSLIK